LSCSLGVLPIWIIKENLNRKKKGHGAEVRPVTITTYIGQYTVPEIIGINNIIVIWRSFYATDIIMMS